ncbi:MAG: hypothetical protein NTV62_01015 [Candidatus Gribaldobacteria bacterium]|nr:hypothetical protein [Candidatus Gribaldobacteria bacterium]
MSHHCQALIFRCMDFRIKPTVLTQLLSEVGYPEGAYDLVSVAGAGKDLLSNQVGEKEFLLKQIQLSQKLHNIKEVVVLYHDNCGAYGIADTDQEHQTEVNDLNKIKSLLGSEFSSLSFQAYIIQGVPTGTLSLEKII